MSCKANSISPAKKVISLFSGAGGLDLGFEASGFDVAVAVEFDPEAAATLKTNRNWPIINRDIRLVSSNELLATSGLQVGDADVLIGGPPCQPFSKAGYWVNGDSNRLDDPRAGTIGAFLRVLSDTLPKAYLLENVPGLMFTGKSEGLELIQRTIDSINREHEADYGLQIVQLNAAHYGVPQNRERVFLIGSRDGDPFNIPSHSHFDRSDQNRTKSGNRFTTAWDAIGDLEDDDNPELTASGKWANLLPSIPEGENYLWHTDRGGGLPLFGWRRRYWTFLLKLAKCRPSWTIQAAPGPATGPFHWRSRRLSSMELCRLQTFPDGYRIEGNYRTRQRQIGNAVPPAIGELLGWEIRRQLFGEDVKRLATLVPKVRNDCPPPESAEAVPNEYRYLLGEHEDHPGTGMGPGARLREEI